jgi:hypothetical protein
MTDHHFFHMDIHDGNFLYIKTIDAVEWYFGDMDIESFDGYKTKAREIRKILKPPPRQTVEEQLHFSINMSLGSIKSTVNDAKKGIFHSPQIYV